MASKRKEAERLIRSLVALCSLALFFIVDKLTHSLMAGGVAFCATYVVYAGVWIMVQLEQNDKLKKSGIQQVDKMTGRQFERYLGYLFKSQGYGVEVTRAAGDYGADLVLKKDGRTIVVQAKRHAKNVGIKAVQEAQASIAYYKANEAWVISNSNFTAEAEELARANGVRLIGRNLLVDMISKMNSSGSVPTPGQVIAANPETELTCDRCGRPMVLRKSARGEFYGCSGFPKCRNIKQVSTEV